MNNARFVVHACTEGRELKAVGEGWAERNKVGVAGVGGWRIQGRQGPAGRCPPHTH
jgi:hypothetical protein